MGKCDLQHPPNFDIQAQKRTDELCDCRVTQPGQLELSVEGMQDCTFRGIHDEKMKGVIRVCVHTNVGNGEGCQLSSWLT